jgi:hypothetical protein
LELAPPGCHGVRPQTQLPLPPLLPLLLLLQEQVLLPLLLLLLQEQVLLPLLLLLLQEQAPARLVMQGNSLRPLLGCQ